ncbi:nodulation protein NfeD [Burkholderiaceae bacterium FT117]|uniref:NfeD family protein n=1 Tax=Zeimonas sediminis TaxID=2944268 RepID=UPI002342F3D1|nr:nodulation protein NfeD [Zeimonas sediminis]MCM5569308.1 nodulation protein NfeD [Zeimonas sediminis]
MAGSSSIADFGRRLAAGVIALLAAATAVLLVAAASAQPGTEPRHALLVTIEGPIGPASADYLSRAFEEARERGSAALVLQMDTPGGLDTSMREMIREIVNAPLPVLAWVGPSGARAASAGTYILYASHVAAMAPGTNLGAATPVAIGGGALPKMPGREEEGAAPGERGERGDSGERGERPGRDDSPAATPARRAPGSPTEAKAVNDAVAYIRSLADMRGRNADWAESAVREAASLPAREALAKKVVDIVADSVDDLLRQAHGREVKVGERTMTLATAGIAVQAFEPDWRTRLLGAITNPNVALILMMIGIYGLVFEFMNPGSLYPGTIGSICLLTGLYALAALPIDYAGLALVGLGVALMVAEAFAPSFGILGIGGIVAFALGATILFDTGAAPGFDLYWPVVAGLAVASLGFTLLVGRLALSSRRSRQVSGREAMLGRTVVVADWTERRGHVILDGERWNAVASGPLGPGQRARILAVDGLTLTVGLDENTT